MGNENGKKLYDAYKEELGRGCKRIKVGRRGDGLQSHEIQSCDVES